MLDDKPLVTNAKNKEQLKEASDKIKLQEKQELLDLQDILKMPCGRRFIWRLLGKSKMFEGIFRQSSEMAFLAGKQDVGHWLWDEITFADREAVFTMMRENMKEKKNG